MKKNASSGYVSAVVDGDVHSTKSLIVFGSVLAALLLILGPSYGQPGTESSAGVVKPNFATP